MKEFLTKHPVIRRVLRIVLLMLIMGLIAHLVLAERNVYWQDFSFVSMSTWVKARFYVNDKEAVAQAARLVQDSFYETSNICSLFAPNSEINRLNADAYKAPFHCSDELWEILGVARKVYKLSNGAFDISIAPLMPIWGFLREKKENNRPIGIPVLDGMPSDRKIADAKKTVGLDKVIFDDEAHTVKFTVEGMKLDLGGIAKGAALDLCAERAVKTGVVGGVLADDVPLMKRLEARFLSKYTTLDSGFISVGGNILVLPVEPPDGHAFVAGVRNPLEAGEKAIARAKMLGESISTSGSYERFSIVNGRRFSHIIDPRTGRPVENMLSVSVIAESGTLADALSTAIFVGGRPVADAAAEEYPGLRVLAFYIDPATGKVASWQIGQWDDVIIPEIPTAPTAAPAAEKTSQAPVTGPKPVPVMKAAEPAPAAKPEAKPEAKTAPAPAVKPEAKTAPQ